MVEQGEDAYIWQKRRVRPCFRTASLGPVPPNSGGSKQATMRVGRRQCSICPSGCVAKNQGLDRGAIHDHAGPHPLFLCAYGISTVRFPRLDGMLETHGVEPLSVSARTAPLAEGLLGYAVAQRRELCRQMGVCTRQSRAERIGGERGSMAVTGRVECPHVA